MTCANLKSRPQAGASLCLSCGQGEKSDAGSSKCNRCDSGEAGIGYNGTCELCRIGQYRNAYRTVLHSLRTSIKTTMFLNLSLVLLLTSTVTNAANSWNSFPITPKSINYDEASIISYFK